MPQGIIVKGIGGFYYIKDNNSIIECKVRGKFRKHNITPMVGDHVQYEQSSDNKGVITEIEERRNSIIRPPVANIDQIILVIAIEHPAPNFMFIDKLIALLERRNIHAVICINKIDLDSEEKFKDLSEIYIGAGYEVINTSAKNKIGINRLKEVLKDKVSAFAGSSGVGKSTLLNILHDSVTVETGELSKKIERGKHTTRHVELFELEGGGFILDTPGFSMLEVGEIKKDELKYCFRDFDEYNDTCKFTGCNHINEPNCSVKDAVTNKTIDTGRYERYKTIFNELKNNVDYK